MSPLSWKLRQPPSHFGVTSWINRQRREFWCRLGWWILTTEGKLDYLLHTESKEECQKYSRSLRVSTSITMSCDMSTENSNNPIQAGELKAQILQEWLTGSFHKVLAEDKGNTERVAEEGSYKYHPRSQNHYRNRCISSVFCYEYTCVEICVHKSF